MSSDQQAFAAKARQAIDAKAKPPGSLGSLEDWAVQIAALQGSTAPVVTAARLLVFAADHGITTSNPGVSAYPRAVSASIYTAIARGVAASATLCKANDCSLDVVDVGLDWPEGAAGAPATSGVDKATIGGGGGVVVQATSARVREGGSRDMLAGPALSPEESAAAQEVGRAAVRRYLADMAAAFPDAPASSMVVCVGELGIGNTTSAAALVAALTGKAAIDVCGRGTGLDDAGVSRKAAAIEQALAANAELVQQQGADPEKVLQAVGGLELAAMVGAYLEAGARRMPVLVDGFVAGAAALVALRMEPAVAASLFWSHHSDEKGTKALLEAAGAKPQPPLAMGLRLGEGTGAVLALPILRSACAILTMATLEEALAA